MQYAIECYFDPQTEEALSRLARRVEEEGISTQFLQWKSRPHLTLACFNDVDEAACISRLESFAAQHKEFPIYLHGMGTFGDTRTIYAAPLMTRTLYDLHTDLHACLNNFDWTGWEWYCPDRWAPHCTLALTGGEDAEAFYQASLLLLREFSKISGSLVSIGLTKITCPVQELYTIAFRPVHL